MNTTNPIQTPLIKGKYYRELAMQYFTVVSDSLAAMMWRGYELECNPVGSLDSLEGEELLVVECRIFGRKRVSYQVGLFHSVDSQTLTLHYDCTFGSGSRELKAVYPNWSIPIGQVKRIWEVDKICRIYAHMHKFYPYSGYGRQPHRN